MKPVERIPQSIPDSSEINKDTDPEKEKAKRLFYERYTKEELRQEALLTLKIRGVLEHYGEGLEQSRLSYVRRYIRDSNIGCKIKINSNTGEFLWGSTFWEWNEGSPSCMQRIEIEVESKLKTQEPMVKIKGTVPGKAQPLPEIPVFEENALGEVIENLKQYLGDVGEYYRLKEYLYNFENRGAVEKLREVFASREEKEERERKKRLMKKMEKFSKALKGEYGREALIAVYAIMSIERGAERLGRLNPPRYPPDFYQRKPRYLTYQERLDVSRRHIKDLISGGRLEIDPETNQFLHGRATLEWEDLTPYQLPRLQPQPGQPAGKQKIKIDVQSRSESDNPLILIEADGKDPVEIPVSEEDALEKVIEYLENWIEASWQLHFAKIRNKYREEYYYSGAWQIFGPLPNKVDNL